MVLSGNANLYLAAIGEVLIQPGSIFQGKSGLDRFPPAILGTAIIKISKPRRALRSGGHAVPSSLSGVGGLFEMALLG
jgi:hypothetical protein